MHQDMLEQVILPLGISHQQICDILGVEDKRAVQEIHEMNTRCLAYPQSISIAFSSQWNRGRNKHTWPASSMIDWIIGFSVRKSSCCESTRYMQHQSSTAADGVLASRTVISPVGGGMSPCSISSAFAMQRSASLRT